MGRKKKPFIDKKNAITFRLVNRSQHDPLISDANAPQHVLMPIVKRKEQESTSKTEEPQVQPEKRRQEQQKFGIFFDDDYNYLQHLREPGRNHVHWEEIPQKNQSKENKPKLQLPSSVFASEFEEDEGMLNKAAKQGLCLDWDPEVVAAMDEDFNFEDPSNELEDNFMEMAMGDEGEEEWEIDEEEIEIDSDDADYSEDEEDDELGPLPGGFKFNDEETKSRFTEYSMSSSVIRRNEQLTLLDDRFEKLYEDYDDPEVGALDCEEIEGHIDMDESMLEQLASDFEKNSQRPMNYQKEWDIVRLVKLQQNQDEKPEEMVEIDVTEEEGMGKKKWDCESILSTYSNIYNHPKLIEVPNKKKSMQIKINPKTGIPMNVLEQPPKLTEKSLAKLNSEQVKASAGPKSLCAESVLSAISVLSIRPKDETPEEKKERKKLLKEYRSERRIEKKGNRIAANERHLQQLAINMNNKNNLAGKKII